MRKKRKFISFLVLSLAALYGWGSQGTQEKMKPYVDITPQQLNQMLKVKDFILINVHIPYAGEIPKTDLFIPYDEIKNHADKLPQEKDTKIVVYCRSDRMSNIASTALYEMGYTNIQNLTGGMVAWQEAGYKLIQKEKENKKYCPKSAIKGGQ